MKGLLAYQINGPAMTGRGTLNLEYKTIKNTQFADQGAKLYNYTP